MMVPDANTVMILAVNIGGWAFTIVWRVWRDNVKNYQHRAMWEEYAKNHKIPTNGDH